MNEYLLIKLLHILGFAYWLGGDLGVFYSSYFVADANRSTDVRVATAKILFALDQAPRICMTLMLPLGTHLAWKLGVLNLSATTMALIWLMGAAWLTMVITLHAAAQSKGKAMLTVFDFFFRITLALGLIAAGAISLLTSEPLMPYWLAAKLMIFGGLVGCGLIVRIKLKPFGPAFANLARGQADDSDNAAIRASLAGTRPFVVTIWAGLIASAALGIHLI
ncbi:MAG: hypothetical protein K0U72_15875 [Gammaproteobacteria bacterium]|nr:hypothetical protein [Gammaproteobacteria bacterium]